ncbi:MAG: hypothetical protein WCV90_06455 [Candidatus Woesearchaeota archaeon]|jgi:hypothetical protein
MVTTLEERIWDKILELQGHNGESEGIEVPFLTDVTARYVASPGVGGKTLYLAVRSDLQKDQGTELTAAEYLPALKGLFSEGYERDGKVCTAIPFTDGESPVYRYHIHKKGTTIAPLFKVKPDTNILLITEAPEKYRALLAELDRTMGNS